MGDQRFQPAGSPGIIDLTSIKTWTVITTPLAEGQPAESHTVVCGDVLINGTQAIFINGNRSAPDLVAVHNNVISVTRVQQSN